MPACSCMRPTLGRCIVCSLLPVILAVSTEVPTPWGDVIFAVSFVTLIFTFVLFLVLELLVLNAYGQSFHLRLSWYWLVGYSWFSSSLLEKSLWVSHSSVVVQSLSCVQLFAAPWTAALQAHLSHDGHSSCLPACSDVCLKLPRVVEYLILDLPLLFLTVSLCPPTPGRDIWDHFVFFLCKLPRCAKILPLYSNNFTRMCLVTYPDRHMMGHLVWRFRKLFLNCLFK